MGMVTENSSYRPGGRCHLYCVLADAFSKKTGTHPATIALNVDRRVGVSPGGSRQNLAFSMGRM